MSCCLLQCQGILEAKGEDDEDWGMSETLGEIRSAATPFLYRC
jgi:hypothetical protein